MLKPLALFLGLTLGSISLFAQCLPEDQIPNQYIVRLKRPSLNQQFALALQSKSHFENDLKTRGLNYVKIFTPTNSQSPNTLNTLSLNTVAEPPTTLVVHTENIFDLAFLQSHLEIDTVEQDCHMHLFGPVVSNDPLAGQQWALTKIQAPQAWGITTGKSNIVVAVSDTGVDYLHEYLIDSMWTNPNEIPGNGIDDDHNGCIDDIHGCDVAEDTGDPMPPPTSRSHIHGTHVAGIIGATLNNLKGISGASPGTKIMAIKGFKNNLDGITDGIDLIKTLYYAANNGARVINCSWGRKGTPTFAEKDAFNYALSKGVVVVVAAGNSNLDASGFSPGSIPGVINVGASDSNDQIADFSNWGSRVDLLAPGGKGYDSLGVMIDPILSTLPRSQGLYGTLIGTSMAAPYVAGAAALVLSVNSNFSPADVTSILKLSGDMIHVRTIGGKEFDYPRLNLFTAVKLAQTTTPNPGGISGGGGNNSSSTSQLTQPSSQPTANNNGGCNLSSQRRKDHSTESIIAIMLPLALVAVLRKRRFKLY
jgi:subtilisin family serine protease